MNNIIIRRATQEDSGLIADLSRSTFYETFAAHNTKENMEKFMNEQFTREKLIQETREPGNIFFLAYSNEVVAGYARLREGERWARFEEKSSIEIARIYAASSFVGRGVGSALMEQCITEARELKREIIWLGVWERNQRAIDFYNRWGFEKFGTHTFLLGDDPQTDWLLMKTLAAV